MHENRSGKRIQAGGRISWTKRKAERYHHNDATNSSSAASLIPTVQPAFVAQLNHWLCSEKSCATRRKTSEFNFFLFFARTCKINHFRRFTKFDINEFDGICNASGRRLRNIAATLICAVGVPLELLSISHFASPGKLRHPQRRLPTFAATRALPMMVFVMMSATDQPGLQFAMNKNSTVCVLLRKRRRATPLYQTAY
jgi:hypothetical protein